MTISSTSFSSKRRPRSILAAALACFDQTGVDETTIAEICRKSGASTGSIYHFFDSKQGIVGALLVDGLRDNYEQTRQRLNKASGAQNGVRTIVESLIDWITRNRAWARFIYATGTGSLTAKHREELRQLNDAYFEMVKAYFQPHVDAGEIAALPADCYAPLILGPVHEYARRWLRGGVKTSLGQRKNVFSDAAWRVVGRSQTVG